MLGQGNMYRNECMIFGNVEGGMVKWRTQERKKERRDERRKEERK